MQDAQTTPEAASPAPVAEPIAAPGPASELDRLQSPRLTAARTPIPGDNPCGKEISYDDDFLRIKAEIDRMETVSVKIDQERALEDARQLRSMTSRQLRDADAMREKGQGPETKSIISGAGGVDFPMIIATATDILAQKSKDLRVAGYLCLALWRQEGCAGLPEGIGVLAILVRDFWEGMYPSKARVTGRKNAVDFLTQRLTDAVQAAQIRADDRAHLESARKLVGELSADITGKMPENPPSFMGLTAAIDAALRKVPKPEAAAPGAAPSLPGAPAPGAGAAVSAELRTVQDAADQVRKVALFLRTQDRKNPVPYRLLRAMRWDVLGGDPPNEAGKTKIEAPPLQRRNYLNTLMQGAQWEKLLDEAETSFGQSPYHFWLDLQRLIVAALDATEGYQAARTAVVQELSLLLRRLPRLPSLTFSDGTKFADPATESWIEETVMPALGAAGPAEPAAPVPLDETVLAEGFDEAKRVLAGGDLAGAIAVLKEGASQDPSGKVAFRRRLLMATLCLRGNQPALARPILEGLQQEIDRYALETWEPSLALEVWQNLHKCYESLASGPPGPARQAFLEGSQRVFEKICRVDVRHALSMTGVTAKRKPPAAQAKPKEAPAPGGPDVEEEATSASAGRQEEAPPERKPAGAPARPQAKRK